jgi:hypothetical protein
MKKAKAFFGKPDFNFRQLRFCLEMEIQRKKAEEKVERVTSLFIPLLQAL